MSGTQQHQSPIVRFLGEDAGAGGPFALLGLPHAISSDEQITRALNRRLQQVGCHRQRSTPDADEVRLALYSAASQLLDPVLRRELAQRWPEGSPLALPKAWKPAKTLSRLTPEFVRRARMIVASSGGWNTVARKRLAHLARLHRISAIDLVRSLSPGVTISTPNAPTRPNGNGQGNRTTLIDPPASGGWLGAYAVLLLMTALLVITVLVNPPTLPAPQDAIDTQADAQAKNAVATVGDPGATPERAVRENLNHYTAIAHELELLTGASRSDPGGSIERFKTVYPRFVESWSEFPAPALQRSTLHIADFIASVAQSDEGLKVLAPILACNRPEPARLMIGGAVLDVALSTPGLSTADRSLLGALRSQCVSSQAQPATSVQVSLTTIAGELAAQSNSDDPGWWDGWLRGVKAATGDEPSQRTTLILSALTGRLLDLAQPGKAWDQTARLLVSSLAWREHSDERLWLLHQFADHAATTPRLAALTEAMATASGADRIDARMVLSPMANDLQRQQLAQSYRDAWFPSNEVSVKSDAGGGSGELLNELRLAATVTSTGLDEARAIEAIIELANLNTAAWLADDGEPLLALDLLNNPRKLVTSSDAPAKIGLGTSERDTQWAQKAINAAGAPDLRPLLNQLTVDGGPGVNSAHALVHLATLDPDNEMRELAQAQLIRFRDRPSVLIAVDHALATARVSSRLSDLVDSLVDASLPPRTDPGWFMAAHREMMALLTRALGAEEPSDLPALSALLADLYAMRGGVLDASSAQAEQRNAIQSAELLCQRLRVEYMEQHPGGTDALDRLTATASVRIARAGSPMQGFLARQREIVGLLSLRAVREVPGGAVRVDEINWELEQRLDRSVSALDQIAQTERAIAQLWTLIIERSNP